MLPVILRVGPVAIHSYGLMIALGFLVALRFGLREAERKGLDPKVASDMAFWALLIGLAGTRIVHIIILHPLYSWDDPIGWVAIWRGGLVFHGGPPPAIVFCYFYLRRKGVDVWKFADIAFPCLALAHAFGRFGCFLNGCCYGRLCDLPWAVPFRRVPADLAKEATGSPAFLDHCERFADISCSGHLWSHSVHPTQLYEAAGLLGIFGLLQLLKKHWHPFDGFTLPTYLIGYGVLRFFVEFLRGDHNPAHFGSFSDQQVFCVAYVVLGAFLFWFLRNVIQGNRAQSGKPG